MPPRQQNKQKTTEEAQAPETTKESPASEPNKAPAAAPTKSHRHGTKVVDN